MVNAILSHVTRLKYWRNFQLLVLRSLRQYQVMAPSMSFPKMWMSPSWPFYIFLLTTAKWHIYFHKTIVVEHGSTTICQRIQHGPTLIKPYWGIHYLDQMGSERGCMTEPLTQTKPGTEERWKVENAYSTKAWTHIQDWRTTLTHFKTSPILFASSSTHCLPLHTACQGKSRKSMSFQPCAHMRFVPDVKSRWKESIRNFVTAAVKGLTGQNMTRPKYGISAGMDMMTRVGKISRA